MRGFPDEKGGPLERAGVVLRNPRDVEGVELAGFHLQPTPGGTWLVYDPGENGDDATLVDELRADQFPSARQVLCYLQALEPPAETNHGDLTAPEVA